MYQTYFACCHRPNLDPKLDTSDLGRDMLPHVYKGGMLEPHLRPVLGTYSIRWHPLPQHSILYHVFISRLSPGYDGTRLFYCVFFYIYLC